MQPVDVNNSIISTHHINVACHEDVNNAQGTVTTEKTVLFNSGIDSTQAINGSVISSVNRLSQVNSLSL